MVQKFYTTMLCQMVTQLGSLITGMIQQNLCLSPWNVGCYRSTLFTVTDGGLSECMKLKIILHRTRF